MTAMQGQRDRRRDGVLLGVAFVVSRVLLVIFGVLVLQFVPPKTEEQFTHLLDGGAALDMWYRWDTGFYTAIAIDGYDWQNTGRPADDLAFLPVYPLLVRAASGIDTTTGRCLWSPYLSTCATLGGLIISNGALLASVYLLFGLVQRRSDRATAWRVVLLLLVSPISIFLSGVYTESVFLLLSLLVFWGLERDRFLLAVSAAVVASLTRSVGMALSVGLVFYVWLVWQPQRLRISLARLLLAGVPVLAFSAYIVGAGASVGDPLAYFSTYDATWGRTAGTPIEAFTVYFSGESVSWFGWRLSWIDLVMTIGFLSMALVLIWRERGTQRGEGLFMVGALLLPIASGTLIGMPRFGLVLFPLYILLGRWADRRWKLALLMGVSALLALFFAYRFVTWNWIA